MTSFRFTPVGFYSRFSPAGQGMQTAAPFSDAAVMPILYHLIFSMSRHSVHLPAGSTVYRSAISYFAVMFLHFHFCAATKRHCATFPFSIYSSTALSQPFITSPSFLAPIYIHLFYVNQFLKIPSVRLHISSTIFSILLHMYYLLI